MLDSQGNINAQAITTRQKLAVAFLLSFTLFLIGMAVYGMKVSLSESLAYGNGQQKIADLDQTASTTDAYLKERDTDKDGLSDYDEMKVYGTSAFLPDTDGDGIADPDELKNGTNPLCAEGQTCTDQGALYNANSGVGASSSEILSSGQQPVFTDEQLKQMQQVGQLADVKTQIDAIEQQGRGQAPAGSGTSSPASQTRAASSSAGLAPIEKAQAQAILKGGASAANLREGLLKAGLTKEQLEQISDDDLLKSYQATLNKQTQ